MAVGDKFAALMRSELGLPGGAAELDAKGLVPKERFPFRACVTDTRIRDLSRPVFDLGGLLESGSVVLDVRTYTGSAGVSVKIDGTAYDAANITLDSENAFDGSIVIRELEG